jgi:preprotein translocase subunit YajC
MSFNKYILSIILIPNIAFAQDAAPQAPSAFGPLIMFLGFFILIYFLMIRPQNKKQKELVNMVAALEKNDEIITASGIIGKVLEIKGAYITVDVGNSLVLKFQKSAVSSVLPKGTIESIK